MSEPSLIELTDDKEFMERVLKKSEEMQEEILRKAEEEEMSQTEGQDAVELLRSENAYLRGKIEVYEKFLKDKGFIKEEQ